MDKHGFSQKKNTERPANNSALQFILGKTRFLAYISFHFRSLELQKVNSIYIKLLDFGLLDFCISLFTL